MWLARMAASGSILSDGEASCQTSTSCANAQTACSRSLLPVSDAAASPCWLREGTLVVDRLKAEIGRCTEQLSAEEDGERQREGADLLYRIIMDIWGLETGQVSRTAADVACDEIRYRSTCSNTAASMGWRYLTCANLCRQSCTVCV